MRNAKRISLCVMLLVLSSALAGCGRRPEPNRPAADITAEAQKMSATELRSMATIYKNEIDADNRRIAKAKAKLEKIPADQAEGIEAKQLKAEIDELNKTIDLLKERFNIYLTLLKDKNEDLSGVPWELYK